MRFRQLVLVFVVLFVRCTSHDQAVMSTYPNVLFILVDDMGLGDLSCTGSQFYETPNVDRIAREGFVFTQGYAASRVCSPSRASIMTGKFTATHGITDWIGAASGVGWRNYNRHDKLLPADYFHGLSRREITLAEAFKSAGYKTFFAGKWHLGSEGSYPEDHGFDINKGGWEKGSPIGGYFSPWTNPKLEIELPGENLSMRLAKETVKFLRANKDSSFFALLSFYAVHGPIQTTREKWSKYRDKAEARGIHDEGFKMERHLPIRIVQDNPVYAGLIEAMDDAVGLVLNELNELGLSENTIVVFTSDNGGVASGDSFSTSNLPLRGGKGYQWEGGIREPYFIKVPWMEAGGKTIAYPVSGVDFYPTLLDLASVGVPANQDVEGISLRPLMEGRSLPPRALYWHYPHYGNQGGDPSSMVRKEYWKLIHYWEDGHDELYQLDVDPGEQSNVASQHPEVVRELRENLDSWLIRTKAKTPIKDDLFDSTLAAVRHRDIVDRFWPELEQKRLQMLSRDFAPNPDWWGSQLATD